MIAPASPVLFNIEINGALPVCKDKKLSRFIWRSYLQAAADAENYQCSIKGRALGLFELNWLLAVSVFLPASAVHTL